MNKDVSLLGAIGGPVAPTGPAGPSVAPGTGAVAGAQFAGALKKAVSVDVGGVPPSPPPEVMREVATAAERADWLREHNRELTFRMNDETGRVQVEVRDLNGRLIREIPPSEALDAMSGGPYEV
jgi:flagellar protein FlaG